MIRASQQARGAALGHIARIADPADDNRRKLPPTRLAD